MIPWPPAPMTSRTAGLPGSPKSSHQSSIPFARTMRSAMKDPPLPLLHEPARRRWMTERVIRSTLGLVPRPSELTSARISIGLLLLVIIRSLSEYFRLEYLRGDTVTLGQVTPYVAGALFAAIALALAVVAYFAGLFRVSIAVAAATLVLLFIYK